MRILVLFKDTLQLHSSQRPAFWCPHKLRGESAPSSAEVWASTFLCIDLQGRVEGVVFSHVNFSWQPAAALWFCTWFQVPSMGITSARARWLSCTSPAAKAPRLLPKPLPPPSGRSSASSPGSAVNSPASPAPNCHDPVKVRKGKFPLETFWPSYTPFKPFHTLHTIKVRLPPPPLRKALKHGIPGKVKEFPKGKQDSHPPLQLVKSRRTSELYSQNTEQTSGDHVGWW